MEVLLQIIDDTYLSELSQQQDAHTLSLLRFSRMQDTISYILWKWAGPINASWVADPSELLFVARPFKVGFLFF